MEDENMKSLVKKIDDIEHRLNILEDNQVMPKKAQRSQQDKVSSHKPIKTIEKSSREAPFLGYIGIACVLLASVLLIKLSIDSGWLTPIRQLILASVIASSLIIVPFFNYFEDKSYISMLPALGVSILHLVVYGAVFYHNILPPLFGVLCISLISLLSLWLLTKLEQEGYAALAIIGTYTGAFFFHEAFSQLSYMALYLILWDITYSIFAINTERRNIIVISSYLSLGLVTFMGLIKISGDSVLLSQVLILQAIQFVIFSIGTSLFTLKNKSPLASKEAWAFFPVIIFFYGQEYYFLDMKSELYATIFSLLFAAFLLVIYIIADKKLKGKSLESGGVVYTTVCLIFAHSIYFLQFNELTKVIFILVLVPLLAFLKDKLESNNNFRGARVVLIGIFLYAYMSVVTGFGAISLPLLILFGSIFGAYGVRLATSIKHDISSLILYLAHIQVFLSIHRLAEYIGDFTIAPLWVAYAFVILYWSLKKKDKDMAKGSILLFLVPLGWFLIIDFEKLKGLERVASLLIMGGLIYTGGYIYKKAISIDKGTKSDG